MADFRVSDYEVAKLNPLSLTGVALVAIHADSNVADAGVDRNPLDHVQTSDHFLSPALRFWQQKPSRL
jgi:hypothetical protein